MNEKKKLIIALIVGITIFSSLCVESPKNISTPVTQTPQEKPPPAVMTPLPPEHYIKLFIRYFNERNVTELYDLFSEEVRLNHSIEELEAALKFAEDRNITIVKWKILGSRFAPGNVTVKVTIKDSKLVNKTIVIPVVYKSFKRDSIISFCGYINDWIIDDILNQNSNQQRQTSARFDGFSSEIIIPELTAGLTQHRIWLKPGEIKNTSFVIYSKKEGIAKLEVYKIKSGGYEIEGPKEIKIRIEPSELKVKPNKWCKFKITLSISSDICREGNYSEGKVTCKSYEIIFRLNFDGKMVEDTLKVLIAQYPIPGWSGLGNPVTHHPTNIKLKAGESAEINFTLYSRESPPGIAKLKAYPVKEMYSKERIPMPEGLSVEVMPLGYMISPHNVYTWKIRVSTSPNLPAGKYVLCLQLNSTAAIGWSWITVDVTK